MAVRWVVSTATETTVDITDRIRLPSSIEEKPGASVGANAEEGSGASVTIEIDDPNADLNLLAHRRIYAIADDAPAGHRRVGNWWISDVDIVWAEPFTPTSRTWIVTMEDENSIIPRKIFVGDDVKRPAETDIERIQWWLTTTEGAAVKDSLYLDTTGPKNLDKADLTGQTAETMLSAAKDASGKNYFIWFNELAIAGTIVSSSVANPTVITTDAPHNLLTGAEVEISGHSGSTPALDGNYTVTRIDDTTFTIPVNVTVGGTGGTVIEPRYSIAYFDFNTYELYESAIRLSNVAEEIDDVTTFALSADVKLARSGGRIASGIFKPFDGAPGYVYVQDTDVRDRYVSRDVSAPAINTKIEATALAEATRQLHEMDEPDDVVTTTLTVQEENVNAVMHGMRVQMHATHLPGYIDNDGPPSYTGGFIWMRALRRIVTQLAHTTLEIPLTLTPMKVVCPDIESTPEGYQAPLGGPNGLTFGAIGNIIYHRAGGATPIVPSPYYTGASPWHFPIYQFADAGAQNPAGWTDHGIGSARLFGVGPGTMDIYTVVYDLDPNTTWKLQHYVDGVGIVTDDSGTITGTGRNTKTITFPDDDICVRWVEVGDFYTLSGPPPTHRRRFFDGFLWTRA